MALFALFTGVYYWITFTVIGYTISDALFSPVVAGFIIGLLLGDVQTGLILGATIQLIYIGIIGAGQNWPADECLATLIVVPLAIKTGLSIEAAAALAVPISLLGMFLNNLRRGGNVIFVHRADKAAAAGNHRAIFRNAAIYPPLLSFALVVPPVFIANYFGSKVIDPALEVIPGWIMHALELCGGVLPCLGIAMTMTMIGKRNNFALFFVSFFIVVYAGMDIMFAAIIGLCVAFFVVFNRNKDDLSSIAEGKNAEVAGAGETHLILSQKDVKRLFFRWYFLTEVSNSFERLQSLSFCAAIAPALKKLYPDKEALSESLERHLQFFNTEGIFGAVIHGTTLAMEEQKAQGADIPSEMITNIKTGLMGPLAGIGDTLTWGTMRPILLGLAASFAMKGSPVGVIFPFAFAVITYILGNYLCGIGYKFGRESIKNLLESGLIKDVIYGAGIMGMFMMGTLAANYVEVSTPVTFALNGEDMAVQDFLDGVVKGMLPLAFVIGTYFFLKKFPYKLLWALLIILSICLLGSLTGAL
ncbi:MAG: PTS system mannose/fructose/sorbose family transporter subunit IID [Clostridiales Family XIII bacterium]|nr:PTS system mannose/fructose/sorbose family transporter subunit IID [Clostridiales Family XIII bacterium]